ncbi:predicted protein [Streptomyces iranensis]|uniref:Uncharacterized protein n=1 Tax=Streptomyces iranensis TaxID=576784 RepID=A0A060ZX17_9ACTN|nr:predicted protein [Streptomyces iranensis]
MVPGPGFCLGSLGQGFAADPGPGLCPVTFDGPLKLGAKGALLAWSMAAMVIHLALTGLFGPRDPEPALAPAPSPEAR